MKGKWNTRKIVALTLVTLLTLLVSTASVGGAAPTVQDDAVAVTITATRITWRPLVKNAGIQLTISGPDFYLQKKYGGTARPTFKSTDSAGNPLADGIYVYELQLMPIDDGGAQPSVDDAERGLAPVRGEEPLVRVGAFTIAGGYFAIPSVEADDERVSAAVDQPDAVTAPADVCYNDDLIVDGSLCVGFDCVCGESFGFDTIRLKENNLRIHFEDTSTSASFPTNDWRIVINDSANGGASYFAVQDVDGGANVFVVEASAGSNALYVDDYGRVGLGTSTPAVELEVRDSDTPSVRLHQDSSGGWTPQTWDLAGNESNFFIRDVTNGSKLPFRIRPNAPSSSIFIDSDGDVGLGTSSPGRQLTVSSTGPQIALFETDTTDENAMINLSGGKLFLVQKVNDANTATANHMVVDMGNGNVGIGTTNPSYRLHVNGSAGKPGGGSWSDSSDIRLKENIEPIDGQHALDVLNQLQGVTFEWINPEVHSAGTRAGLVAQDVEQVFPDWVEEYKPQGSDAALIPKGEKAKAVHFPHDFNAYAIEAIKALDAENQALAETVEEQDAKITALQQQNADLEARLTALEEAAGVTNSRASDLSLTGLFLGGLLAVGVVVSSKKLLVFQR
jgi:hypothetical protein